MKEVTKDEVKILVDNKIIFNSKRGYADRKGNEVGFYRTRNKRYMEDSFVDMARKFKNRK